MFGIVSLEITRARYHFLILYESDFTIRTAETCRPKDIPYYIHTFELCILDAIGGRVSEGEGHLPVAEGSVRRPFPAALGRLCMKRGPGREPRSGAIMP